MASIHSILLAYFSVYLISTARIQVVRSLDVLAADEPEETSVYEKIDKINKNSTEKLFEGDILVLTGNDEPLQDSGKRIIQRESRRLLAYLWRTRIVPYEISSNYTSQEAEIIKDGLKVFEEKTCLKFKTHSNESNWIIFKKLDGCFSAIGKMYMRPGPQTISLGNGCLGATTVMHEVMHALGFWHEQSRPDRDKYVEIFWENIKEGQEDNFEKYPHLEADNLGIEYDHTTIMHYDKMAFSKNGKPTIKAIGNSNLVLGGSKSLNEFDITQINALYDCKNSGKEIWSTWSKYGPCSESCYKKRQRFCSHSDLTICPEADKYGIETQSLKCTDAECYAPIDGHWSRWSLWSVCAPDCGERKQTRKRYCVNPAPKYGGATCPGNETEYKACTTRRCTSTCDFESDFWCSWKNDLENSFKYKWARYNGNTPSANTGPEADHTTGKGYYIYVESSSPAETGQKARIIGEQLNATKGHCLSFWYHMNGKDIGALRVFLQSSNGKEQQLWIKTGNNGNKWLRGYKTITSDMPYKIIFEAERGAGYLGDIALDDISFKESKCDEDKKITMCGIDMKKLGCFGDSRMDRTFGELLDTHRDDNGDHSMFLIDWFNYKTSLNSLLCHCAERVKRKGYKYFGIQYYAECWSGPGEIDYKRHGPSTKCINGSFKDCIVNNEDSCSGTTDTNFIYKLL